MGDSLAREDVLPRLRGRLGREYRYVESTPSTQLLVRDRRQRQLTEAQLPEEVDRPETSLPVETGREIDRADLVAELLEQLERGYDEWVSGARG